MSATLHDEMKSSNNYTWGTRKPSNVREIDKVSGLFRKARTCMAQNRPLTLFICPAEYIWGGGGMSNWEKEFVNSFPTTPLAVGQYCRWHSAQASNGNFQLYTAWCPIKYKRFYIVWEVEKGNHVNMCKTGKIRKRAWNRKIICSLF